MAENADAIEDAIRRSLSIGSMTKPALVDALAEDHGERDVKIAFVELLNRGQIEEHPEIDEVYRVCD